MGVNLCSPQERRLRALGNRAMSRISAPEVKGSDRGIEKTANWEASKYVLIMKCISGRIKSRRAKLMEHITRRGSSS